MGIEMYENDALNEIIFNHAEHEVFFHTNYFFKFLIYHLGFFTFGPFFLPVIVFTDSMNMARNMAFWGWTRTVFV